MSKISIETEWKTYKLPISFEKTFNKSIRPLGQFVNYPDFIRDAVREKQNKILGVKC